MFQESKDALKDALYRGEAVVTFVKKDGTQRIMRCTLSQFKIPEAKWPKNSRTTQSSEDKPSQTVFDVELGEWRSFRWDSIIQWNALSV